MSNQDRYREEVNLKYQLYNGLFVSLPFEEVRQAGILLPILVERARQNLPQGVSPEEIIDGFFADHVEAPTEDDRLALLFRFVQLVERQVVLFDALEDAAFPRVHDVEGAGTLNETLARISQAERHEELSRTVERFRVRVVLTAHPTQFYPGRILGIITDLADALAENHVPRIYDYLLQLGKTRFGNRRKPSPMDEARSLVWYLENVFYHTFPSVHSRVARAARADRREALNVDPVVELGFWPGGDRDGNPFVDADTTRDVAAMLRAGIIDLYRTDVEALSRRLTFDGAIERLSGIHQRLGDTLGRPCEDHDASPYAGADDFFRDLMDLWDHLNSRHDGLFVNELETLMWRVKVFGFHFATLDLRQDSRVISAAVDRLLAEGGSDAADPPHREDRSSEGDTHRLRRLERAIDATVRPSTAEASAALAEHPVLADTVESLRAAREIQHADGSRALHRYIISNTQRAENILEVLYVARTAGYPADGISLDIVPLFETVDDLEHAERIMTTLYESSVYRRHLERRGNKQQIMLGFSDGTKDGGYVTANWLIYRARERLSRISAGYGVRVVYFEGRGGPPARGGGKTHQFYRGMGPATAGEEIHLTVQGQTISSNFGTVDAARFNLEQLVTAGLESRILSEDFVELHEDERRLLDRLSDLSLTAYRQLKQHPDFLPYLETMTPLTYYGDANNASRPTSRGNAAALTLGDLRAIPFVGAWSQMKQNVPGYYGFGSALATMLAEGDGPHLRRLYREHLFFRTLVENSMQSISKVNMDLTRFLAADERFGEIWRRLDDELTTTRKALLDVAGADALLPNDGATRASIQLRESIVLPVLVIQQYALIRLRAETEQAASLKKLVVKSMAAIVNAGRNSV